MTARCPNGHTSQAEDFCDTCGAKIDPGQQPPPSGEAEGGSVAPVDQTCPNCQTSNAVDALFCEACGYDFTTGALPRGAVAAPGEGPTEPAAAESNSSPVKEPGSESAEGAPHADPAGTPGPVGAAGNVSPAIALEWVAEVWVDPDWYSGQEAEEPMPSAGLPGVVPLLNRSALIGRVSASRNIVPDVDCTSDTGVSRRHAQLSTDGRRWFVEDLGSSNGTFVGPASGPLPEQPISVGPRTELDGDDRVYVGAWTRIVVRRATDDEIEAHSA